MSKVLDVFMWLYTSFLGLLNNEEKLTYSLPDLTSHIAQSTSNFQPVSHTVDFSSWSNRVMLPSQWDGETWPPDDCSLRGK